MIFKNMRKLKKLKGVIKMNKFRKFIILGTMALTLVDASTAFANTAFAHTDISVETNSTTASQIKDDYVSTGSCISKKKKGKDSSKTRKEREAERLKKEKAHTAIIESAEKLIPGSTAKYTAVEKELTTVRKDLYKEIDALKTKVDKGEITKEQMKESLDNSRSIGKKGNGDKASGKKSSDLWNDLETAIKANDSTGAQTAFDAILAHKNSRLTNMKERLEALK
jgi:hypothetical protein